MINPRELREGNIADILLFGAGEKPVSMIPNATLTREDIFKYKGFEGVSLTEEWLVKAGAILNHKFIVDGEPVRQYYIGDLKFEVSKAKVSCSVWPPKYLENFKYVHQLQNLYFALTGEELTIQK